MVENNFQLEQAVGIYEIILNRLPSQGFGHWNLGSR